MVKCILLHLPVIVSLAFIWLASMIWSDVAELLNFFAEQLWILLAPYIRSSSVDCATSHEGLDLSIFVRSLRNTRAQLLKVAYGMLSASEDESICPSEPPDP